MAIVRNATARLKSDNTRSLWHAKHVPENLHVQTFVYGSTAPPNPTELALLVTPGDKFIRHDFNWVTVEQEPGVYERTRRPDAVCTCNTRWASISRATHQLGADARALLLAQLLRGVAGGLDVALSQRHDFPTHLCQPLLRQHLSAAQGG